ncbi:Reticulon [Handroanthus impetiginosus]|uniref:Reticulon-like protein n=1 Tax=Handroanthus impetiginosus TaxID=429701 RepID=A0A2G9HS83_9LAMI|nr:Reticulon [Handroanthus impetiginosus]
MPEEITAESLVNNLMETISHSVSDHKNVPFFEENSSSVKSQFNRLFGRDKPLHHLFGGGKSADVLLWRDKKISASVLTGATIVWVLFEWLNYHFLTLLCFVLVLGMLIQFVWANASGVLNRSPSSVARLVLPEEYFVNIGKLAGSEVNRGLCFLQDVACGGNIKQFLVAVACLCAAAIIGSWCNFLTVLYVGFIAAHTLPVLYERYEDEVDSFIDNVLKQLRHNYRKLDDRVLSRIPTRRGKKYE